VKRRLLGRTGLQVSELSLGTVSLGIDYGIRAVDDFGRPTEARAIELIRRALDGGVTLIDTSPGYGDAERIVGLAAGPDPRAIIATKVALPAGPYVASAFSTADVSAKAVRRTVESSLESSRQALNRDAIDILQIRNATLEMIEANATTDALLDAKARGLVRALGATVYDESAAMAVIASGHYDVVQVAFNVLDQRKLREVIPAARDAEVGVIVRSAFLKGVLTRKAEYLPAELERLRERSEQARNELAARSWARLEEVAMRFCLSEPRVSTVLTGPRTLDELEASLAAEAAGPLDAETMARAASLAMDDDDALLDPSRWPSIP
jgi:aryl-alcohol dehydrogenase-like predicted oxidoreductase